MKNITIEEAKSLDNVMMDWYFKKMELNFINEDDEYQCMANFLNEKFFMETKYINQAGDIVLHNGEKYLTVKREQLKEVYDAEKYSIEGVVVVPNDKTHDGTTRMISLVGMDCGNPEHGCANEDKSIVWGECDFKIPEFKSKPLNDLDGKENTETILKYYTAEDWKTVDKISNKYDKEGYYPAAACCKRYKTKHTDDWYLPAIGELTYLYDNFEAISKAFDAIIDVIGTDNARQIPVSWFWSSSELSSGYARFVYLDYGDVGSNFKFIRGFVRAFASINYLVDKNLKV